MGGKENVKGLLFYVTIYHIECGKLFSRVVSLGKWVKKKVGHRAS